jgi:putative transposase
MPRIARPVFPGLPHHVTQRGNRQATLFFVDAHRRLYLDWLCEYCRRADVRILAYCLMTNHVHFVAVPGAASSFEEVFHPLHTRYARRINQERGWNGHLMQGRYFSAALDERHLWNAIRYVERNPVRAGMVARAEDYAWSSAATHCGLCADALVQGRTGLPPDFVATAEWSEWLKPDEPDELLDELRSKSRRGLPVGSEEFVANLERQAGMSLRPGIRGRPWHKAGRARSI